MTHKTKIILLVSAGAAAGVGFWLWWRQKDAVPASAVPLMQQARAVMEGATGSPNPVTDAALVQSVFPTDMPLPTTTTVTT